MQCVFISIQTDFWIIPYLTFSHSHTQVCYNNLKKNIYQQTRSKQHKSTFILCNILIRKQEQCIQLTTCMQYITIFSERIFITIAPLILSFCTNFSQTLFPNRFNYSDTKKIFIHIFFLFSLFLFFCESLSTGELSFDFVSYQKCSIFDNILYKISSYCFFYCSTTCDSGPA